MAPTVEVMKVLQSHPAITRTSTANGASIENRYFSDQRTGEVVTVFRELATIASAAVKVHSLILDDGNFSKNTVIVFTDFITIIVGSSCHISQCYYHANSFKYAIINNVVSTFRQHSQ